MLNEILWPDHIQWQPPTDQTLYRTRPFTEFSVVSIEHLRRVWHVDRGRVLLRTPSPVPMGLAYVLLVQTNPFQNLSLFFSGLCSSNIPRYFLDFAFSYICDGTWMCDLRSGSKRHRHFVGLFKVSFQLPSIDTGPTVVYYYSEKPPHLVAFYYTLGIWRIYSHLKPPGSRRKGCLLNT